MQVCECTVLDDEIYLRSARKFYEKMEKLKRKQNTIIERNTMVAISEVNDKTRILKAMQNVRVLGIVILES